MMSVSTILQIVHCAGAPLTVLKGMTRFLKGNELVTKDET